MYVYRVTWGLSALARETGNGELQTVRVFCVVYDKINQKTAADYVWAIIYNSGVVWGASICFRSPNTTNQQNNNML